MKAKRREREEATVEMTPLIDVVFLLLIFFMVSTTFIRETQLKITLPEASGELQEIEKDIVEVTVDRNGEYAVNNIMLPNKDIRTLIRALEETIEVVGESNRLVITADANVAYQAVIRAMDAAGRVGLTQISITTQQPSDED